MATLGQVLTQAQQALASASIEEARREAEVLLTNVLQTNRAHLYAYPERELEPRQQELLGNLLERRKRREPLAYILGYREFYGLKILVRPGVMIPRPETELLIDQALLLSREMGERGGPVIAEPGTGSGAISIVLATHLPTARIYATDISLEALRVARMNVNKFKVGDRVTLLEGDLLEPVPEPPSMIVANLPYIPSDRIHTLQPEIRWEPREALDGGRDGLDVIKRLLQQAQSKLRLGGGMLLEIDCIQGEALKEMAQEMFPGAESRVEKDLAGLDRVFCLRMP